MIAARSGPSPTMPIAVKFTPNSSADQPPQMLGENAATDQG